VKHIPKPPRRPESPTEPLLFALPQRQPEEPKLPRLRHPVWTEHKANLIARYLYYFVLITKHGTYIDGFAGPQRPDHPEMWSAKLVMESEPRRLRHFYLFDKSRAQILRLKTLLKEQPFVKGRTIQVFTGDFNLRLPSLLRSGKIKQSEATLCLLDQRTFQCHWRTLERLSNYKERNRPKIELFYFLAVKWLPRAISASKRRRLLRNWWGRQDWKDLKSLSPEKIKDHLVQRFKSELGYKSVLPYPIHEKSGSSTVVYYMIHATDHGEAPKLMVRAYNRAVRPRETPEQFLMDFTKSTDTAAKAN
jgi:three-Cys-motif partner protein